MKVYKSFDVEDDAMVEVDTVYRPTFQPEHRVVNIQTLMSTTVPFITYVYRGNRCSLLRRIPPGHSSPVGRGIPPGSCWCRIRALSCNPYCPHTRLGDKAKGREKIQFIPYSLQGIRNLILLFHHMCTTFKHTL